MLKTISAALLATSLIAAPAFAAGTKNTATSPVQTTQSKADATGAKIDLKTGAATTTRSKALNANAKMNHHGKHVRHHRSHQKMSSLKTHKVSKISTKPTAPASKRG